MQRASKDRKQENLDFRKTVADRTATAEISNKALEKMATFYDNAAFAQTRKETPTPPVPQMEYPKSKISTGEMSMIEKLIYYAKDITAKSKELNQELIERLLQEAANESNQKGWCDKATADAKQKRTYAAGKIEDLNVEMAKLAALSDPR